MPHPFTNAEIEAMCDAEIDDRLMVATGRQQWFDAAADPDHNSPQPWWWRPTNPVRRRIYDLLGIPSSPWSPVIICASASVCAIVLEGEDHAYDGAETARWNAEQLLKAINAEVET